tara:strand:+ start:172 stop:714 length:543 start_codon:yes stop_codon:yes gene_type:complete
MTIRFEVHGLQGAIATLRKYDRAMYEIIIKDLKDKSAPLVSKVAAEFPDQPFRRVNNWHSEGGRKGKSRMPAYNIGAVRKGVKPAIYSTSAKVGREQGIFRLNQNNAGGAIYDGAGGATLSKFVKNLDMRYSTKSTGSTTRSRVMYPTMLKNMNMVQEIVDNAISKTNKQTQTHIMGKAA